MGFLLTNSQRERAIQLQGRDCGPACGSQANCFETVPSKVNIPVVATWMEQAHELARLRVHNLLSRALTQRTGHTGKRQIIGRGGPSDYDRCDVVHMKASLLTGL